MPSIDPKSRLPCRTKLLNYSLASLYAHVVAGPEVSLRETAAMVAEATLLREQLRVGLEALAFARVVDESLIAGVRTGRGHMDIANGLVAASAVYSAHSSLIAGRTAITPELVERAATLGPALGERMIGEKEAARQDDRLRGATLLARAYGECRRAIRYLRYHHGDAAMIAPTFYRRLWRTLEASVEGCSVRSQAKSTRLSAAGASSHALRSFRSHRNGR